MEISIGTTTRAKLGVKYESGKEPQGEVVSISIVDTEGVRPIGERDVVFFLESREDVTKLRSALTQFLSRT